MKRLDLISATDSQPDPNLTKPKNLFIFIFLAGWSVLDTPLLMSPIFVFLRDIWIRTQRVAVAIRRPTELAFQVPSQNYRIRPDPDLQHWLKVHKIENFFGFDFGICVISFLVMSKY